MTANWLDYQRLSLKDLLRLQQRFLKRMGERPEE
jgi:linoleoyl-CoA desaturase